MERGIIRGPCAAHPSPDGSGPSSRSEVQTLVFCISARGGSAFGGHGAFVEPFMESTKTQASNNKLVAFLRI